MISISRSVAVPIVASSTYLKCTMAAAATVLLRPLVIQATTKHTASVIVLHGSGPLYINSKSLSESWRIDGLICVHMSTIFSNVHCGLLYFLMF